MLSVLIAGFLIKHGLVISYTTSRIILVDKERMRLDAKKYRIRWADIEKMRLDIEREERKPASAKEFLNVEELADVEKHVVICYKQKY